jgi:hypothetical protein
MKPVFYFLLAPLMLVIFLVTRPARAWEPEVKVSIAEAVVQSLPEPLKTRYTDAFGAITWQLHHGGSVAVDHSLDSEGYWPLGYDVVAFALQGWYDAIVSENRRLELHFFAQFVGAMADLNDPMLSGFTRTKNCSLPFPELVYLTRALSVDPPAPLFAVEVSPGDIHLYPQFFSWNAYRIKKDRHRWYCKAAVEGRRAMADWVELLDSDMRYFQGMAVLTSSGWILTAWYAQ